MTKLPERGPCVVSIHIAREKKAPLEPVDEAKLVMDHGIEGDRYWNKTGTFSKKKTPDKQVTLIEEETLLACERDYGLVVKPGETRRNITTRGIALNHLVGKHFRIGEAVLEGMELCEPCGHLAKLTNPELRKALVHRGGLRARIVSGGVIRPGSTVTALA